MSLLSRLVKEVSKNTLIGSNSPSTPLLEEKLPNPDEPFFISIQQTEDVLTYTPDGIVIQKNLGSADNQQWFLSKEGFLKNKNNGLLLSASGETVILKQEKGDDSQKWIIQGTSIVNKSNSLHLAYEKKDNKVLLAKKTSISIPKWTLTKGKEEISTECYECGSKKEVLCIDCNQFYCDYCSDTLHQLPSRDKHQKHSLFERCSVCSINSKYVCLDCNLYFCINCAKIHSLDDHKISLIEKKVQVQRKKKNVKRTGKNLSETCSECHKNDAETYCFTCEVFLCNDCDNSLHLGKLTATYLQHIQFQLFKTCIECQEQAICYCAKCNSEYCQVCCNIYHKLQHNGDHSILSITKYMKKSELEMTSEERLSLRKEQKNTFIEAVEKKAKVIDHEEPLLNSGPYIIGTVCVEEKKNYFPSIFGKKEVKHDEDENIPLLQLQCEKIFYGSLKHLKFYDSIYHMNHLSQVGLIDEYNPDGLLKGLFNYDFDKFSQEPESIAINELIPVKPSIGAMLSFGSVASDSLLDKDPLDKVIKPIKESQKVKSPYVTRIGKIQASSVNDNLTDRIDPKENLDTKDKSHLFLSKMISQKRDSFLWRKDVHLLPYEEETKFLITPIVDKNLCIKESIFVTIHIYDIEKEQKVSEDYSFFILSKAQKLPKIVESQLDHVRKECIFTVRNPSTSLILFINVDTIIKNQEQNSSSKKLSKDGFLYVTKKSSWGYLKLCTPKTMESKGNFFPGVVKEEAIAIESMYKYKDEKSDLSFFTDCIRKGSKEIEKKFPKTDLPIAFETFIFHKDTKQNFKTNVERMFIQEQLSSKFVVSELLEAPKPYLAHQSKAYVYPLQINVRNASKYMNIKVSYRKSDVELNLFEKKVYCRVPSEDNELSFGEQSCLGMGSGNVKSFTDEFIIELPGIENKNHIFFTIYSYDDSLTKREIFGYSYLQVLEEGFLASDRVHTLDIYSTVNESYLSSSSKLETKGRFDVKLKLMSSYHTNNPSISKLLSDQRNQNFNDFAQTIMSLQPSDKESANAYFPMIMDKLFKYLESISEYKNCKKVWKALQFFIDYIGNIDLFNWYATHIYHKTEGFLQLFQVIPKFIIRNHEKGKMEIGNQHRFLFDLIIKNIMDQLNSETFKVVQKDGYIDLLKDLDEKFVAQIEFLTKLVSEQIIKRKNIQGNIIMTNFLFELVPILGNVHSLRIIEQYLAKIAPTYDLIMDFFKIALGKPNWIPLVILTPNCYLFSTYMRFTFENTFETNVIYLLMNHISSIETDARFKDLKVRESIFTLYFKIFEYFVLNNQLIERVKAAKDLIYLLGTLITIFKYQSDRRIKKWLYKSQLSTLLTFLKYLRVFSTFQKKEIPEIIFSLNRIISTLIARKSFLSLSDTEQYIEGITLFLLENLTGVDHTKESLYDTFLRVNEFVTRYDELLNVKECKSKNLITKGEYCWRLIVGGILLNTSYPLTNTHPFIVECLMKFIKNYSEKFEKELEHFTFDEEVLLDKNGKLKGASIGKLIILLFDENMKFEQNYEKTFLLTYQSFMTSEELFFGLLTLYHKNFKGNQLSTIRLINFMVDLVKTSFYYLDNHVLAGLIQFLSEEGFLNSFKTAHKKIKKNLITKLMDIEEDRTTQNDTQTPGHILPKEFEKKYYGKPNQNDYPFNFLEWSAFELANQMTIIESELFRKIEPRECFGLGFSKPNRNELAPNIVALSERFNRVCNWIQASILKEPELKIRQQTLQKWIEIAKVCHQNNNFSTLNQIFGSLNLASIHRLKATWDAISDEDQKFLEQVGELFSNPPYPKLKKALLNSSGSASIPFFGMYQTELTFIEDGNPNDIKNNEKELVNFGKRRLYYDTLKNIQLYQQHSYNLMTLSYLNYHLTNMKDEILKEQDYYDMSLLIEPRKN